MITLAKQGDLHARRQALAYIQDKQMVHKLFAEIKNRFLERNGGYTKITKLRYRQGDGAPVSVIELLGRPEAKKIKKKKSKAGEALDKVKGMMPGQGKKEETNE
jgi:large subunit ribosomal protein L17